MSHTTRGPSAWLLVLLAACGVEPAEEGAPPPPAVVEPPRPSATVHALSPWSGEPGTDVTLEAEGLPPDAAIEVGFGAPAPQAAYEVLAQDLRSDAQGTVTAAVTVPEWAEAGRSYFFAVGLVDRPPSAVSPAFHVTGPDGVVRLEGTVTDEGVECLAMRSDDGDLYTLTGPVQDLATGNRVHVEATIAEASHCMQGVTLDVRRIERT